ncbi:30S ribosomal protein S27ae [Candidatus Parvarchaeota archaeon]|jgi:small subunit ribosomal protein S27Ae|uniref:Small ribosomal subunit protein eS31 n=1 Tax=Candidatus Acidifodinimicrobium mancum TaxID=2898728 RepID=A0A8T3UZB1_9ARCH|nr:30S ribosomal protein S27ae [Candidatus Acidifodinimicrobium mancum]MBE5728362.1 30S ribosomal protein S27ae [Candidatus Acidifodinimicrobium mancum]MBE5728816.1 30S ribosomal protein S27ae [Candidatus Acidifodinimicrobium mancum]MBE5729354.1 30S ribosomal protein S27ae [Candidatus Acidifodinimicrobium mancum]MBE5730063.1 30S ribosomal protein S27ae [Candidatus Acidifodinimicrobium mancum]
MPKKKKRNRESEKVYKLYKIEGDKLVRLRKTCPKCGEGVFLAQHKDRLTCGRCGYTEFLPQKK